MILFATVAALLAVGLWALPAHPSPSANPSRTPIVDLTPSFQTLSADRSWSNQVMIEREKHARQQNAGSTGPSPNATWPTCSRWDGPPPAMNHRTVILPPPEVPVPGEKNATGHAEPNASATAELRIATDIEGIRAK
ncbi:hypothetical protein [Nocardia jiangsuensis]|uniref:Secreted protein n=1 Tax=Nocardia jiangsuensis TaxID=1691563 RepID=A0ABV8DYF1_9NOCA